MFFFNLHLFLGFEGCVCNLLVVGKVYGNGWSLSPSMWTWGSSPKLNGFDNMADYGANNGVGSGGHCSTVERLYAWEKKLYQEVKVCSFLL